jgi:serine/threonine-protein kinase
MPEPAPSPASADRNLLFGVLALQADLLDNARFAEACSAWATRKDTPLADLLVERGWLTPGDRADVERLLERKLQKHRGDARASLAEVTTDEARRSLAGLDDTDVRRSLAGLATPPAGPVLAGTTAYVPESRGRYALTRLHATGGIGRVWLARDDALGRDVALKELRPERAAQPAVGARFLREARITGQLEHPGVVPIYEVGQRPEDRQPFYTMRFVRGRTLAEATAAYHRRRAWGEAGPLELRELLGAFVGVCNAVAYAHSRGVLHRDLKPPNVVLGDFGEVIVLDWGLARLLGQPDGEAEAAPVPILAEGESDATVQGQVLGTPAYMAPEQAEGRLDLLGPATDVYGLGAVLYEVLSGRPPFPGGETTAVLRQAIHEEPPRPRELAAGTPRALEAVCLKALAKKPAGRYGTAKELAAEVQRWLADEPVTAWREPITYRARRWLRRHSVAVAGTAAAAAVALLSLSVGLSMLQAKNTELGRAKDLADERFRQTRKAVDDYFTDVSENPRLLRKEPGTQEIRRALLERARQYYENFLAERGDDPGLRAEAAAAYFRLAGIIHALSPGPDALALYEKAREIQEGLAGENPDDRERAAALATTYSATGAVYRATGQTDRALECHQQARAIQERLVRAEPTRPALAHALAQTYINFAEVHYMRREYAQAMEVTAKAQALLEPLAHDHPKETRYARDLARVHLVVGNLLSEEDDKYAEALAAYNRGAEIYERLVAENPAEPEFALGLTTVYNNIGNLQDEQRLYGEALKTHAKSLEVRERLVRENPGVAAYSQYLAGTYTTLGHLYYRTDKPAEARAYHEKARAILERLVRDNPAMRDFAADLGRTYWNMGQLVRDTGRPEEALEWYGKAIETLRGALARAGQDLWTEQFLRSAYWGRAQALAKLGRDEEAEKDWQEALRLDTSPAGERTRVQRAYGLAYAGRHASAVKAAEALATTAPVTANALYSAAAVYGRCSEAVRKGAGLTEARQAERAESYAARAVELLAMGHAVAHAAGPAKGREFVRAVNADKDFAVLRSRADFQKLMKDLEGKPEAKGP